MSLFSGFNKLSKLPDGKLAKALSVGAKTVNGPSPLSVSTNPADLSADTKVLSWSLFTAVSTISLESLVEGFSTANTDNISRIDVTNIFYFFIIILLYYIYIYFH